jgi:antitoxin ParD1/3/4
MSTVTISLPDSLKSFVDEEMKIRGFGNVSEYFRGLLREAQEKAANKKLESLLLESLDSGEDIVVDKQFWSALKGEISTLVKKHQKSL